MQASGDARFKVAPEEPLPPPADGEGGGRLGGNIDGGAAGQQNPVHAWHDNGGAQRTATVPPPPAAQVHDIGAPRPSRPAEAAGGGGILGALHKAGSQLFASAFGKAGAKHDCDVSL